MIRKKYNVIFFLSFVLLLIEANAFTLNKIATIGSEEMVEFTLSLEDDDKNEKVKMVKYDEDIYELAYTTYLQSKNTKNAYAVAMSAVEQQPKSKLWRERLAQVALWNKEPTIALDQYLYLAKHFNDKTAELRGRKLAESLYDDFAITQFLMSEIKNGNQAETIWQKYKDAMLRLGEIQKLTEVLNSNRNKISARFYLETLSTIYKITDDPHAQRKILEQLGSIAGMKPRIAEQLSAIYLNEGNIEGASRVLRQARNHTHVTDAKFWDLYAKVSYLTNKQQEELYAYQQLKNQSKPDVSVYTRLVELTTKNEPNLAYSYALQGRKLYPNNYPLITDSFALLADKNQCLDFPKILATIPLSAKKLLKYDTNYWGARANYWKQRGNNSEVIHTYLSGMSYLPMYDYLKADFLFFLIEINDTVRLKQVLARWENSFASTPRLWSPAAQAYARINKPIQSWLVLSFFYDQFNNYQNNPYWLILFKDTLENSFFPKQAAEVNHYAWPKYLNLLRNQSTLPDYTQQVDYVKLSMLEAAGDPTAIALSKLQTHVNKDVELLMLTWALSHNNTSLAQGIYWYYLTRGIKPPAWAALSIALNRHDQTLMRKLLLSKKAIVSFRDRIRATTEIEAIPLAQTLAYKELARNRKDQDLYDNFFTPLMLRTSDNVYVSQEYYQYGNVAGPRTNVSYTYFLTPGTRLKPYNSTWFTHNILGNFSSNPRSNGLNSTTNQILATVPGSDERVGLEIDTIQRRGNLNVDIGYRHDLNALMTAKMTRTYQAHSDLDLSAVLGYHQPADDTAGLLVGGMENTLALGFNYRLFAKDNLLGNYKHNVYYTQGGQYLAKGMQGTLRYEHKFWKRYPDWTLSPYGVVTQYFDKRKGLLTGSILKLVPKNVPPTVNFLIPANFTEYGLTFSWGQSYSEEYTHRWRPFALYTISQSSTVGIGKLFNLGIAGTVVGRDHVLIYYEKGTNQGQGLQAERLVKVSYRIYV